MFEAMLKVHFQDKMECQREIKGVFTYYYQHKGVEI